MGRKRDLPIRTFFNYDNEKQISVCKVCERKLSGSYTGNLKRFMMLNHSKLYLEQEQTIAECNAVTDKKIKVSGKFSTEGVKNACVDLVTKDSLPFAIFDSNSLQYLTAHIFEGLGISRISSRNIMSYVTEESKSLRQKIIKLCKGKLIS